MGLILLAAFCLDLTYDKGMVESGMHKPTLARLDSILRNQLVASTDTLRVGWSRVNLTPDFTTSLAGYGISEFDSVMDSVWVRAMVFDDGTKTVAIVSPDLLIFPPTVADRIDQKLKLIGIDAAYYSATHTHHSLGNWHPGLVGRLFAGPYREDVVKWLVERTMAALKKAKSNLKKSRIGFAAIQADDLVLNRLVPGKGSVDPWFRFMKIEQDSGDVALLHSFSAHATTISRQEKILHRDYPGFLTDALEQNAEIDFAMFLAGAAGSMGPNGEAEGLAKGKNISNELAAQSDLILNILEPKYQTQLNYYQLDVDINEPQLRISKGLRLRPWLFDLLFGEYEAKLHYLRIGQTILIGTPADFSGELVAPHERKARNSDMNLMITSFNGDYIGYITKDEWYNLDAYETKTMNWFGPGNEEYFSLLIKRMLTVEDSI